MTRKFDLFGEPMPENLGSAGANGHVATAESVNKVRQLVCCGWSSAEIATELGISVPTLNKHYFKNSSVKKARKRLVSEAKARVILQLEDSAAKGNVAAQKALIQMLEKEELAILAAETAKMPAKPKGYVSKKQTAVDEAEDVASGGAAGGVGQHIPDYGKGRVN